MKKPHKPSPLDYALGAIVGFLFNALIFAAWAAAWVAFLWLLVAALSLFK